jgi:hypothetical protein
MKITRRNLPGICLTGLVLAAATACGPASTAAPASAVPASTTTVAIAASSPAASASPFTCPPTGVGGNPLTAQECAYLTDLDNAGLLQSNSLNAAAIICEQLNTSSATEQQLAAGEQLSHPEWTAAQANQYVLIAQVDMCGGNPPSDGDGIRG